MRLALGLGTRPAHSGQPSPTSSQVPASHDSVRQRRRFAQDGDVPVVILHRGRDSDAGGENKLAALTADLREERAARAKCERALEEANGVISSLMTKLKHAEMTLEEKVNKESEARAQWDAILVVEREARQQAETKAAEAVLALSLLERKIETAQKQTAVKAAAVEPEAPAPAQDLFGELDDTSASPAGPKRRASKTISSPREQSPPLREQSTIAAAPKRGKALERAKAPEPADDEEDKPIEWWLPSFRATRKTPGRRKRATP
jgi:hypothetical protein